MKFFAELMAKIPASWLPRIEQSIAHAVEVISDPRSTSESYEAIGKELAELQKSIGKGAAEAWQGEVAERLKADWIKAGRDGIEMEKQVTAKMTQVLKAAERFRKTVQWSLRAAAEVAVGLAAVTIAVVGVLSGIWEESAKLLRPEAPAAVETPPAPVIARPELQIEVARPERVVAVHRPMPPAPFSTVLPELKELAVTACSAPEQFSIPLFFYRPYDFSYREYDDYLAKGLSSGLGDCARQLFNKLIERARAQQGLSKIERQWVSHMVAAYSRTPDTFVVPPPRRGNRCEDFGNIRCP